jgi:hypothetical protein
VRPDDDEVGASRLGDRQDGVCRVVSGALEHFGLHPTPGEQIGRPLSVLGAAVDARRGLLHAGDERRRIGGDAQRARVPAPIEGSSGRVTRG